MKNYKRYGLFDFDDCLLDIAEELNDSQLLGVNGGYCGGSYSGGCGGGYSGGGGSGYSGQKSGSSSGSSGKGSGGGSPSSYGQCGGFTSVSGCSSAPKASSAPSGGNSQKKEEENKQSELIPADTSDIADDKKTLEAVTGAAAEDGGATEVIRDNTSESGEVDSAAGQPEDNGPDSGHWGGIRNFDNDKEFMQEYRDDKNEATKDSEMNGEKNLYSTVGCKMQGAAKILSEILGLDVSISKVNEGCDTNNDGLLCREEIESYAKKNLDSNKAIKTDYFEKTLDKSVIDSIPSLDGDKFTYVLGRAEDVHGGQHWIVLEGYNVNDSGQVVFDYNATSKNDGLNNRTYILGPVDPSQKETYTISKIETYTVLDKH